MQLNVLPGQGQFARRQHVYSLYQVHQSNDFRNMSRFQSEICETHTWKTRHVFVKHGCPRWQQSPNMAKFLSPKFWPRPNPRGHVMSVKCEKPLDELTVQVWLQYDHPNFKYCTLCISGTELRTDRQTDGQTDGRTIQTLDAPGGPFRPGA